ALMISSTGSETEYLTLAGSLRVSSLLWESVRPPSPPPSFYCNGRVAAVAVRVLILVSFGIALPALLAHSGIIVAPAMVMSIIGGILIYGTIISFAMFFQ